MVNIGLNGKSESTLKNYGRSLAKAALYFGKCPTLISDEKINQYLLLLRDTQQPSYSYFKHTVYGLRLAFRLIEREDRAIRLPSIKKIKTLPTVLSRAECRTLFSTPKLLKHRTLLCLVYSAGLRISEVANLRQADIDMDRMQIHIRQSKNNKDRMVPLAEYMKDGLLKYYGACCPREFVFNGGDGHRALSVRAIQYILRETVGKTDIKKRVTLHTLRHSYATHLCEDGLDILTIRDLLGHEDVTTTMVYLHVAGRDRSKAYSPFDTLYSKKQKDVSTE